MILLPLSAAQATHVAQHVTDPELLNDLCQQLRLETLCPTDDTDRPSVVIFKAVGGTLRLSAISYFDAAAAIRAEDRFWARVQAEAVPAKKRTRA